MGRKRKAIERPVAPDPKYNSVLVSKFVNRMMWEGKRSICLKIVHEALEILQQKSEKEALEVFTKAIDNVKPVLEVKSRRVGGATYQVPVEIRESRREALGMRWIIQAARARSGHDMSERLAAELLDAYNNTGTAVKKKEDTHKMAEANKAFAHYRW
ncbi:30S ribosomal protein S7 [Treponema sp. J25]|jgi:small subunit ribosomal protein S7|uniref:30S ribosomal protein S7 n=1 Tax=Treponema sp. J25 TaxID=2094121 RepID=UPI0010533544|nr:30S ribosomal protein S7 [Treponema sp. J25]TCW61040.1 30S ribosomal protein S7 [Treponema sp. J25]